MYPRTLVRYLMDFVTLRLNLSADNMESTVDVKNLAC